ncbi:uncharacterized protein BO72DRAFT_218459 [Aspergillus fijiensis CBS 313.89]|uniref:Uncharacterized protein n=1 Tax=Aspergillus fijiensis CBS 313.89 TaxID=1448319 RepID=A0A8G1VV02_9EURO|nr:uncharacterized protein BO72DRAFT_218459 [Aspergillus fijiensis CBS 313.89]RAK73980.1 hypothetical protein BO72DRAFT_218459 [Aspergillus fijiensis CBS 313.89]
MRGFSMFQGEHHPVGVNQHPRFRDVQHAIGSLCLLSGVGISSLSSCVLVRCHDEPLLVLCFIVIGAVGQTSLSLDGDPGGGG